jgi:hypothetical protein
MCGYWVWYPMKGWVGRVRAGVNPGATSTNYAEAHWGYGKCDPAWGRDS